MRLWRRRRRLVVILGAVLFVGLAAGGVHAWRQRWLTSAFLAASRSCGELEATTHIRRADRRRHLAPVASADMPTTLAFAGTGGPAFLGEREGQVWSFPDPRGGPVLDLSERVDTGDDQGLLGLAVDARRGWLYAWFPQDGVGRLVGWPLRDGRPDPSAERVLLTEPLDTVHHNGGGLATGPDGRLYLGIGDGGLTGDPDGNAQDLASRKGKVLRVDPGSGAVDVVAAGLRNPYRIAVDPWSGVLWIADVGHECMEEVNRLERPGLGPIANLGWNRLEGTRTFLGGRPEHYVPPAYAYPHDDRHCAVIGGGVVRGPHSPRGLRGAYLVGDFCSGRLVALRTSPGGDTVVVDVGVDDVSGLLGMAVAPDGRVFVLSIGGGVEALRD